MSGPGSVGVPPLSLPLMPAPQHAHVHGAPLSAGGSANSASSASPRQQSLTAPNSARSNPGTGGAGVGSVYGSQPHTGTSPGLGPQYGAHAHAHSQYLQPPNAQYGGGVAPQSAPALAPAPAPAYAQYGQPQAYAQPLPPQQ